MVGNSNKEKVVCCFCGETLLIENAALLIVQPNYLGDEKQQLFCHKNHFVEKIDKSIFLHPDFFEQEK